MNLSRKNLLKISAARLEIPDDHLFNLPEKIIQFGTGVLLRALPDYFVDKANKKGIFNGRIVIVKSTPGEKDSFDNQDCLYTLAVQGIESGVAFKESILSAAISRVLTAHDQWQEILDCASKPELQIVISNTTEVGIQYVEESIMLSPPNSFPGKLLAFLYERFKKFNGAADAGMIIVPTELITDNGQKLKDILNQLSRFNELEESFISWLNQNSQFCNSLVDRIVPGKPSPEIKTEFESEWGYEDELVSICEVYRLWAIEGGQKVRETLSFSAADQGMIITEDITKYKELKLRMLNGTHSVCCAFAFLCSFPTVKSAMGDASFEALLKKVMFDEIGSAIPFAIPEEEIREFGLKVIDRFKNPFLEHQWLSITMQYTSKLAMRILPVLNRYYERFKKPPEFISLGIASYILFMKAVSKEGTKYFGEHNGRKYPINDDKASYFFDLWEKNTNDTIVGAVFASRDLWPADLNQYEGFTDKVSEKLKTLSSQGANSILASLK